VIHSHLVFGPYFGFVEPTSSSQVCRYGLIGVPVYALTVALTLVPLYIAQAVLIRTQPGSAAFVLVTTTNNYVGTICGVFATGTVM
jgi:hypothetical protein